MKRCNGIRMKLLVCLATMSFVLNILITEKMIIANDDEIISNAKKFSFILKKLESEHPDSLNLSEFSEDVFDMMLKKVDPYSDYINKDEIKRLADRSKGSSLSFPFSTVFVDDTLRIVDIDKKNSNEISYRDRILFVNEYPAKKEYVNELKKLFTDDEIEEAIFVLMNENRENRSIRAKKYDKALSAMKYALKLDEGLLYAKNDMFSGSTLSGFVDIVKKYDHDAILIDLRDNSGGYVYAAADLASCFIDEDKIITTLRSKSGNYDSTYVSKDVGINIECPLLIMVNEKTASAAEIFAGCLQDHDRAYIVGNVTEGKGFIQKVWSFSDSTAVSMVVGSYYTPLGRSIQKPYKTDDINELEEEFGLQGLVDKEIIDDIMKKTGGRKAFPTYKTKKGRIVIGGGGIMPDKNIQGDSLSFYLKALLRRQVFVEFAFKVLDSRMINIEQYESYISYEKEFDVGNDLLYEFAKYLEMKNMFNSEMFNADLVQIKLHIKSFIAYIYWQSEAFNYIMTENDIDLKKALEYVRNAEELIKE